MILSPTLLSPRSQSVLLSALNEKARGLYLSMFKLTFQIGYFKMSYFFVYFVVTMTEGEVIAAVMTLWSSKILLQNIINFGGVCFCLVNCKIHS